MEPRTLPEYAFNRWRRFGHDRLYVSLVDASGSRLGIATWRRAATTRLGQVWPESDLTAIWDAARRSTTWSP